MSNSQHVIVIMYNGKDIPEYKQEDVMAAIIALLATNNICIPELTTVVYKDSEGIAASIARDVFGAKEQVVQPVTEDPIKNALTYIKKRYETELAQSNLTSLVLTLAKDIDAHKKAVKKGKEGDILLMNALEIIVTSNVSILQLAQADISERALNVIEQCYRLV